MVTSYLVIVPNCGKILYTIRPLRDDCEIKCL